MNIYTYTTFKQYKVGPFTDLHNFSIFFGIMVKSNKTTGTSYTSSKERQTVKPGATPDIQQILNELIFTELQILYFIQQRNFSKESFALKRLQRTPYGFHLEKDVILHQHALI